MNGCGCNYWKELIKSAWGLATTSVRAVKTKDDVKYPDGDGLVDLSDIAGGEGTVTSVNGKQPDAQGAVTITGADIATPDGTVQGDIETLGTNLASEISARTEGDSALQESKQDTLTDAQLSAVNSGITTTKVNAISTNTQNLTRLSTRVDGIDTDVAQLKISDAEHTSTLADQATQLSAQATEITNIKSKDATQDSSISALQTKTANHDTEITNIKSKDTTQDSEISALKTKTATHDTEIQGLTESVVSDLTGTFTESSRTLKLSLERESAPSIDCSVVIPGGTGGGAVDSVNGKTGTVVLSATDVLTTAQQNAANSGITTAKVSTYDGYATHIDSLEIDMTGVANSISDLNSDLNGKADASTVTQIQTAVGGCFNDASVSGNNLILSTVGGQQNTLTLPGGGGGASLPADGYYWEKITEENWPTDWDKKDIILFGCPYIANSSVTAWDSAPTSVNTTAVNSNQIITSSLDSTVISCFAYNNYSLSFLKIITETQLNFNQATTYTKLLHIYPTGLNSANLIVGNTRDITRNNLCYYGLYRLRKFA